MNSKINFKFSNVFSALTLLLGIIFFFVHSSSAANLDLNRSIGWGWESGPNVFYYFNNPLFKLWILIFPITYWKVIDMENSVQKFLANIQIVLLFLIIFNQITFITPAKYLNLGSWGIFILGIIVHFSKNQQYKDQENESDKILDSEIHGKE